MISVLLLAGCSAQTVVKYQCADGYFVDSADVCPPVECQANCPELDCSACPVKTETKVETKTVTNTVYVCSDLTEVKNMNDCLKADSEGWYEVKTFSGAGQKQTEPFQITSNYWRYSVNCKDDPDENTFEESLYHLRTYQLSETESEFIDQVSYQKCSYDNSPNYIYQGNGKFYFDMEAYNLQSWSIKVEAKK